MNKQESILDLFLLGLKTWLEEIKWLGKSVLARFEISRLEKELEQEYGILGRITESPKGKKEEKGLCLKQVSFLKEEIETLKSDLASDREERMKKLRSGHNA
jgi:cell division protein FtsB